MSCLIVSGGNKNGDMLFYLLCLWHVSNAVGAILLNSIYWYHLQVLCFPDKRRPMLHWCRVGLRGSCRQPCAQYG